MRLLTSQRYAHVKCILSNFLSFFSFSCGLLELKQEHKSMACRILPLCATSLRLVMSGVSTLHKSLANNAASSFCFFPPHSPAFSSTVVSSVNWPSQNLRVSIHWQKLRRLDDGKASVQRWVTEKSLLVFSHALWRCSKRRPTAAESNSLWKRNTLGLLMLTNLTFFYLHNSFYCYPWAMHPIKNQLNLFISVHNGAGSSFFCRRQTSYSISVVIFKWSCPNKNIPLDYFQYHSKECDHSFLTPF